MLNKNKKILIIVIGVYILLVLFFEFGRVGHRNICPFSGDFMPTGAYYFGDESWLELYIMHNNVGSWLYSFGFCPVAFFRSI